MSTSPVQHRLVRPRQGRMVAGVCAGLAERFGISRFLARLLFLFVPGPNIIVYGVLWIVIPAE